MEPIYEYLKNIDFGLFVSENAHVFIKTINIDNKRVSLRICLYHETDMANWYIYMYYGFWEENKKVIYSHVEDIDTDCIDYDAIETMINTDIHNTMEFISKGIDAESIKKEKEQKRIPFKVLR